MAVQVTVHGTTCAMCDGHICFIAHIRPVVVASDLIVPSASAWMSGDWRVVMELQESWRYHDGTSICFALSTGRVLLVGFLCRLKLGIEVATCASAILQ